MIPHTFRIGNNVEVIGPSITGNDIHLGKRFKIECMYVNPSQHIQFEPYDGTYYPASSLQLVEPELKIGDFAEVILPDNPFTGKIGQVSSIGELTVALYDIGIWSRGNLRKLAPDEIKQHTAPTKEDLDQIEEKFKMDRRLSAIEKRLDFIEKFQREQAEYRRGMLWMAGP